MILDWKSVLLSATTLLVIDEALSIAFELTKDEDYQDARGWPKEGLQKAREEEVGVVEGSVDDVTLAKVKEALQIAYSKTLDEKFRFALFELIESEQEADGDEFEEDLEDGQGDF